MDAGPRTRREPRDAFSQKVLHGAERVLSDRENPIRLNLFAAAIRELFRHTLDERAPDASVIGCSWYVQDKDPGIKGPTRVQKAKYATQGGLSDAYVAELGVDVDHLHRRANKVVNKLHKYTHVQPGVIVEDEDQIERFATDALEAYYSLIASFDACRDEVLEALYEDVDREVVDAFVSETLLAIDELASRYSIEMVEIGNLEITSLTDKIIDFKVEGSITVQLQWGGSGDDGAEMENTFPFKVWMSSTVEKVDVFHKKAHEIDTRSWFDNNDCLEDDGDESLS